MQSPMARPGALEVEHDASVTWRYLAPAGHTLEMCLAEEYWRGMTRELGQQRVGGRHAWNKVVILAEDGSWEAELRVVQITEAGARLRLVRPPWTAAADRKEPPKIPAGWKAEHVAGNGWRVIDKHGKAVAEKLPTEDAAYAAILARVGS